MAVLVPTPSAAATRTGSRRPLGSAAAAPPPPSAGRTPGPHGASTRAPARGEAPAGGEVGERIGGQELADAFHVEARGDELALDLRVDAVEAGVVDGRGAGAPVGLGRAGP